MAANPLPIILFDTKKNQLPKDNIIDSQTFYIYSFQNFGIRIIGFEYYDATSDSVITVGEKYPDWQSILDNSAETIFSAKVSDVAIIGNSQVIIDSQKQYGPINFGYTIFISQNLTKVWYELTDIKGNTVIYSFQQRLSNIITDENQHYLDLIINNYLPTPEELLPALFLGDTGDDDFSNREILKRLLLDFRSILRYKGTKRSIELFFNFVGINNLNVFEEWLKPGKSRDIDGMLGFDGRPVTLNPDTKTDTKTGNYYVEYFNWEKSDELTPENLPVRKLSVEDLDKFFATLKQAIALANTYFTLLEQEIVFFGLVYSSNNPIQQNIKSLHNVVFRINPLDFRKHLIIDNWQNSQGHAQNIVGGKPTAQYKKYLFSNLVQQNALFYRSEIKFIRAAGLWTGNLFWVDSEISDFDIPENLNPETTFSAFGTCFNVLIQNNFDQELTFQFDVSGVNNESILETRVEVLSAGTELPLYYIHKTPGIYHLKIKITDIYNNSELYEYQYTIDDDYSKIDFDLYTSKNMVESNIGSESKLNDITTEVDSPSLISTPVDINYLNYILSMIDTPANILEYYHKESSVNPVRWLTDNQKQYIIPIISIYDIIDDITDTIPLELTEQFVEICTYPYSNSYKLMIRWFDASDCQYKLISYSEIQSMNRGVNTYGTLDGIDKLFVTVLDVYEQSELFVGTPVGDARPYMFIMSTETGLDIATWDFVVVPNTLYNTLPALDSPDWKNVDCFGESVIELRNHQDVQYLLLPVNHDYPLFIRASATVPGFPHYISIDTPKINIPDQDGLPAFYPVMKSMFPRLTNIMNANAIDGVASGAIDLKLADVVLAKINRDFITEEVNITWSIVNTFTGEVLHQTTDLSLKYRLTENTIYTVRLDINIDGKIFQIYRPSIISSFKKTTLLEN